MIGTAMGFLLRSTLIFVLFVFFLAWAWARTMDLTDKLLHTQ